MLELGYISQEDYNSAINDANANNFNFKKMDTSSTVNNEWFVYPALNQVKKDLIDKYKYTEEEDRKIN